MKNEQNSSQDIENQDIEMDEGFTVEGGDENAETAGETSEPDNVAEKTDKMSGDSENCATTGPAPLTPEEEAAIWRDKFLRLSAEYENFRKRTAKEKLEIIAAGGEEIVRSMLEVLDDMDRALAAIEKASDLDAVKQGIALIDSKLRGALKSRGLAEIEAVGEELDTDLHEAIARIEVEEKTMKGKIVDVVQKGYKLKEKIIRYAKVVVGQ